METFRNLIRGWLGKVLLVLFLAPLAIGSIGHYFGGSNNATALKINGEDIPQQQYDQWLKSQQQKYLQAAGGDNSLLNQAIIEKQVYDAAVLRTVLLQQAKKLGITLTDTQLGGMLRQLPELQENGQFSQAKLDQLLANNQMTVPMLLEDFRKQTMLNLLTNSILESQLVSQKEGDRLIAFLAQERSAQIAEIPLAQFAQNYTPSATQIQQYFQQHQAQFKLPASVDVDYVVLSKANFNPNVTVTEQDIAQQYQKFSQTSAQNATRNVSHILIATDTRTPQQALARAQEAAAKLKNGANFDAIVQQYSDDPLSKAAQGKIDGYSVGVYGEAFDQAVLGLQTGQISAPVKTEFGYHLIRLDQMSASAVASLAQVREQMVNQVKKQKIDQAYQDAINNASDIAVQHDDLTAVAQHLKLTVRSAKAVTASTFDPVLSDTAVKAKLMSPEVAQGERSVSSAITLKNGDVVWLKPVQYHSARSQNITEATPLIQTQLRKQAQIAAAQAHVKPVVQRLNTESLNTAIASSGLKFQNLGAVPRFSQMVPVEVEKAIYSAPRPTATHAGANTTVAGDQLYVVAVTAIQPNPQFNLNDEQRKQVIDRFYARGQNELNDYLEYLRSTAKIEKTAQATK